MSDHPTSLKWHPVDSAAALVLTTVTNSPGVVYPLATADLPEPLQRMAGVSSYYVTAYSLGQPLPQGRTVAGELLVARADGVLMKHQFAFAASSNGAVYFTGSFKGFGHHVGSGQAVSVASLFNQTPFSTKGGRQGDGYPTLAAGGAARRR